MTVRSRSLQALLLCGALLRAPSAHADPSPTEISPRGRRSRARVSWKPISSGSRPTLKLREALAVKDTPGLRFHLAHCEDASRGSWSKPRSTTIAQASSCAKGAKAPDVQKLLVPASADAQARMPRLTVEIPSDVPAPVAHDWTARRSRRVSSRWAVPLNPGRSSSSRSLRAGAAAFDAVLGLKEGSKPRVCAESRASAGGRARPVPSGAGDRVSERRRDRLDSCAADGDAPQSSAKLYLMVGESAVTVAGLALGDRLRARSVVRARSRASRAEPHRPSGARQRWRVHYSGRARQ